MRPWSSFSVIAAVVVGVALVLAGLWLLAPWLSVTAAGAAMLVVAYVIVYVEVRRDADD